MAMIYLQDADPSKVKRYMDKRAAKRFMEKQKKDIEELSLKLEFAEQQIPDLQFAADIAKKRFMLAMRWGTAGWALLGAALIMMQYGN